jgi:prepilin-type N-terminal cleavage/methylation domain-containing protein
MKRRVAVKRAAPNGGARADGFTLVEMCFTMAVFGVLVAAGSTSMLHWTVVHRQKSTVAGLDALFRETQQRAVTEGRPMCVDFDLTAQTWAVYRGACADATRVRLFGPLRPDTDVRIQSASFDDGGTARAGVTFLPRGTATPGTVKVTRTGSVVVDTLVVDGLTGRVRRA